MTLSAALALAMCLGCTPPPAPSTGTGGAGTGSGGRANGSGGANASGGATPGTGGAATGGNVASSGGASASGGATPGTGGAATGGQSAGTGGAAATGGRAGGASGTGGSSGGGGSTGPAGPCGAAGILFCDDFEKATAGMPPSGAAWTTAYTGSAKMISVDATTPAKSGKQSVKVSSAGNYQTFIELKGAPLFPTTTTKFYLRLYIRLGAPMSGNHNTYFKAGAAGAVSSNFETRVGVQFEMLVINQPDGDRGFMSNPNYWNDGMKPGVQFPSMQWTCVEVLLDPPNSTIDMWVNDTEVAALHRTDWKQDPIGSFHFGYEKYGSPEADIWYDDIAIGTERIHCY